MINSNGTLVAAQKTHFTINNRALKYGDAVFETIKVVSEKVHFLEAHYFRLMASMHLLRMEVPMYFDLEYFEQEILKTVAANHLTQKARVRVTVFRKDGGLFTPKSNNIDFEIEATVLNYNIKKSYLLDLFKDHYIQEGLLSTIKTNNRMVNVLGSIFASENGYDNCLLLNNQKHVVEALNGNVFIINKNHVRTPSLKDGCINGVYRKKIIEVLQKNDAFTIEEASISPFEIQKADEVFLTNAIMGVQPVTQYKKKKFETVKTLQIKVLTDTLV